MLLETLETIIVKVGENNNPTCAPIPVRGIKVRIQPSQLNRRLAMTKKMGVLVLARPLMQGQGRWEDFAERIELDSKVAAKEACRILRRIKEEER